MNDVASAMRLVNTDTKLRNCSSGSSVSCTNDVALDAFGECGYVGYVTHKSDVALDAFSDVGNITYIALQRQPHLLSNKPFPVRYRFHRQSNAVAL